MCGLIVRESGSSENLATWKRVRRTGSALGPYEDASRSTSKSHIQTKTQSYNHHLLTFYEYKCIFLMIVFQQGQWGA